MFADARKGALSLPEQELLDIISHNNLMKEIHHNEQLCTVSFLDGLISLMRFQNCFILPLSGYFCKQNKNEPNHEDVDFDDMVLYYQYVIDTPSGEVKRDVVSYDYAILFLLLL